MDTKKEVVEKATQFENEAYVYLKNGKALQAKGVFTSNGTWLEFISDEFTTEFRKESVAVVIRDIEESELPSYKKEGDAKGFEIYTESGTSMGFNGWSVGDDIFISEHNDLIVLYEPIAYVKSGAYMEAQKAEAPVAESEEGPDSSTIVDENGTVDNEVEA